MSRSIVTILLCTILCIGTAWGQHSDMSHYKQDEKTDGFADYKFLMKFKDKLELSENQLNQIKELKYELDKALIRAKAELELANLELQRLLEETKPSREELFDAIDNTTRLTGEIKKMIMGMQLDIKELLSEGQNSTLEELKREAFSKKPMKPNQPKP